MKKILRFILPLLALAPSLASAGRAADAPGASPYAMLESLVGGTWVATLPGPKDAPPRSLVLRMAWNENKQGVRFDSSWVVGEKTTPYTSGMYAWNAVKKSLVMFYTDSGATLAEGAVTIEGNVLVHDLTMANRDGSTDQVRVRLTKVDRDTFTNEIFIQKDGAWAKIVEVKYERRG